MPLQLLSFRPVLSRVLLTRMQWLIADTVPPHTRIEILTQLAAQGALDREVVAFARVVPREQNETHQARALLTTMHREVPYRPDPPGLEVFQDVRETLAQGGDCEDLAVLFVSLAQLLGLRARVVWLDQQIHGAMLNHVYPQVWLNGVWVDADPSVAGAELGESPMHAAARLR
ncbi:MAG: transglutaminase-like domain-containing protein [Deltaproteobacteria bacterium]|nr:transglutaminase-like domain-containing protein [Deltaproteobacteria bacterium]